LKDKTAFAESETFWKFPEKFWKVKDECCQTQTVDDDRVPGKPKELDNCRRCHKNPTAKCLLDYFVFFLAGF
jgi:hypothetical protein